MTKVKKAHVAFQVSLGQMVHMGQWATRVLLEAMVSKVYKVRRGLLEWLVLGVHGARKEKKGQSVPSVMLALVVLRAGMGKMDQKDRQGHRGSQGHLG